MIAIGIAVAVVLAGLATLHVYWAVGGRWGVTAAIPTLADRQALFAPHPAATLLVAAALVVGAWLVLSSARILPAAIPAQLIRSGTALLSLVFIMRAIGEFRYVGFFKRVRGTTFARWDTRLHSPLCLVIGIAAGFLAFAA